MRIFDWAKDLEKIYEDLLTKVKEQNLNEIEEFKKKYQESLEETQNSQKKLVTKAFNSLQKEVDLEISRFKEKLEKILNEFEQNYNQNEKKLVDKVIKELGFDFSAWK